VTGERHDTGAFETCQIVFWRGYFKCAFYAVFQAGEPLGSPFFRCRERLPLQSGAPLEAHQALIELLTAEGWEPATRGRAWYSLSFRRREWSNVDEGPLQEAGADDPTVEAQSAASAVHAHVVPTPVPEVEPAPAPALESKPEPVPAAAESRFDRQRALLVATVALVGLAVGLGLTVFDTNSAQGRDPAAVGGARTQQTLHARQQKAKRAAAGAPVARHTAANVPTTIVVTGSRGNSWVEARVGTATGKSLFAGVVSPGQTVRVTAPVVWITFGNAENLDVHVNGRAPVAGTFRGTIRAVIAHGRVRAA
jgi:hypothetical protein